MSAIPTSGQARINAKRTAREAFWTEERRTVLVRVSAQFEPHFREQIHLLGERARIDGSTKIQDWFALDLNVHIPGAPANAVRAEPVLRNDWHDDHYEPILDHVQWTDADGKRIHPEVEAIVADAHKGLLSPNAHRAQMDLPPLPVR